MNAAVFRTVSGTRIDLFAPEPASISFDDMAEGLSRLNRYCGATFPREYSVAQHSVHVVDELARAGHSAPVQLYGLLHDGHEYLIGDITISLERRIGPAAFAQVQAARADCDRAIFAKLRLPLPLAQDAYEAVNAAHDRVVLAEMIDITRGYEEEIASFRRRGVVRFCKIIRPQPAALACEAFKTRFTILAAALDLRV